MRKWFVASVAFAVLGVSVYAQQVQVQQAQQGQAQPAQIQIAIDPVDPNIDPNLARALIAPGFGVGVRTVLGQADAIVVGRVVAIEPMDVDAAPAAGQPNAKYRIAVVQVTEIIHGVKKDTQTIRVVFIAQGGAVPGNPGGINGGGAIQILPAIQPVPPNQIQPPFGRRPPFLGNQQMQLQMGQDGLFTLTKHHKENFYLSPPANNFVNRQNNNNFDTDVKTAKQLAKVMGDPVAALKSEDQQERFLAAAILVGKYRNPNNPNGQPMKTEPINADESKLILKALTTGDWTVGRFNAPIPNAYELFTQLGVTPKDGYNPVNVRNQQDIVTAMQKFLADNGDKYVIQKLVVDPNAKGVNPVEVQPMPVPLPINPRPPIKIKPAPPVKVQPIKNIKVQPVPVPAPAPVPVPDVAPAVDPAPAVLPAPAPVNRR